MNDSKRAIRALCLGTLLVTVILSPFAIAQDQTAKRDEKKTPTPGPMLAQGTVDFDTPEFTLTLVRSSQTVAALKPKGADNFDFTPGDLLVARSHDGYFHLGDITFRLQSGKSGSWKNYSTAVRQPVTALPGSPGVLAAADLGPTLPSDIPLRITRTWAVESNKLVLRFAIKNTSKTVIEVGALGIPMIFNSVLNDRSLEEAHAKCSFYDPYIGEDAGYLQVTRLSGRGPALLVVQKATLRSRRTTRFSIKPIALVQSPSSPIRLRVASPSRDSTSGWCTARRMTKMSGSNPNRGILQRR